MEFFSDREQGIKEPNTDEINVIVWNGIGSIFEKFVNDNSFSKDFPLQCPDGRGVCGCNIDLLNDSAKGFIPNIEIPIARKQEYYTKHGETPWDVTQEKTPVDTYAILDFIEFCFYRLSDAIPGDFHEHFGHFHYTFRDRGMSKERFREDINLLFQRNGVAYQLDRNGKILRVLPEEFKPLIYKKYKTGDETLNKLLHEGSNHFLMPKLDDRIRGLERLWDAFERAKTYYGDNKKVSASQLISLVSSGNKAFEVEITQEAVALTSIGNNFQIRHFEKDKQPITDIAHVDYLFFRMFSLIDLFVKELEK